MLKFAQIVHFDQSDLAVYARVAPSGEWAVSGGFEFATDAPDAGKAQNAFEKGWLGIGSFGRATAAMVVEILPVQLGELRQNLATYLQTLHNAPSSKAALAAADQEIAFMQELCEGLEAHTVVLVHRTRSAEGIHEECRAVQPRASTVH